MQEYATIESYRLGRLTNFSNLRAVIFLYDQTDDVIGRLEFLAANVPTSLSMAKGYPELHYPIEAFADGEMLAALLDHDVQSDGKVNYEHDRTDQDRRLPAVVCQVPPGEVKRAAHPARAAPGSTALSRGSP